MIYLCILLMLLIYPDLTVASSKASIELWANSVLPNLLPFFIISKIMYYNDGTRYFKAALSPFFKVLGVKNEGCFPYAISILCGFPTGSRIIHEMKNDGLEDIDYYGNICYCASPLFILGTVGTVTLESSTIGYSLYAIHLCTLFIFTAYNTQNKNNETLIFKNASGDISKAITESITSILSVCCYMVIFNIVSTIIISILNPPEKIAALLYGICEFTHGIKEISQNFQHSTALPLISFFLSFGGICVISQCLGYLDGINKLKFVLNRIICGMIAYVLCFIYTKTAIYIPITITTIVVITRYIYLRHKNYLLKSARSCAT